MVQYVGRSGVRDDGGDAGDVKSLRRLMMRMMAVGYDVVVVAVAAVVVVDDDGDVAAKHINVADAVMRLMTY